MDTLSSRPDSFSRISEMVQVTMAPHVDTIEIDPTEAPPISRSVEPTFDRGSYRRQERRFRKFALAALLMQFIGMAAWSETLWSRYSITHDGSIYLQAASLISHGHLNPFSTVLGHPVIKDHFTLALWPLSLVTIVWPHGLMLLWAQDAALVAAEFVAFSWMTRIVNLHRQSLGRARMAVILGGGLLVMILNPWTYSAISFDVHIETFACPFVIAAAYDFSQHRNRRAWIWVACMLSFGDVTGLWVVGLGLSAIVAAYFERGRHHLRTAAFLFGAGALWVQLIGAIGANVGSTLSTGYGYLVGPHGVPSSAHVTFSKILRGLVSHPGRALRTLASHRLDIFANLAPSGVVGLFTPWTIGVPVMVLLSNNTIHFARGIFSAPSFQSSPVYEFCAVGLIICLVWIAGKVALERRALLRVLVAVGVANALVWSVVWIPSLRTNWLRITTAQAAVLSDIARQIAPSDEVIASQGVMGRFSERKYAYDLQGGAARPPLVGRTVWFVLVPNAGIETQQVNSAQHLIGQLAGPLQATLIARSQGIWAFRLQRRPDEHRLVVAADPTTVPAWTSTGAAGSESLSGLATSWNVESSGTSGYVVSGDYWNRPVGDFKATVTVAGASAMYVEVWDDNKNLLVARQELPASQARQTIEINVPVTADLSPLQPYSGWGPFRIDPPSPTAKQVLEIRIWSPAGAAGHIYSLSMSK